MATFAKAKPKQARLKLGVYGPPGSGKTFTALLFSEGLAAAAGRRVAFVDTERGTDFYSQSAGRAVHPDAFDFDALYTRSLAETTDAIRALDPAVYGVVVLDSVSHLWDAAIEAYTGKRTSRDTIPFQAWAQIKKPYKALISFLIGSPFHVLICGRQKNIFEDDADGGIKKVGVGMRAESDTPYEPHICVRMESIKSPGSATAGIADVVMHVEKDRTGVLAGRSVLNPSFETIRPLLALLGDEQADAETDSEARIEADAELLAKDDEAKAAKAGNSRMLLDEFTARLMACSDLASLGGVAQDIKKAVRKMQPEHVEALRQLKESVVQRVTSAAVPSIGKES